MTRLGLHAVAILYTGGSIAQLLRLVFDFPLQELPYAIDWAITLLGSIGAITLVLKIRRIHYRGWWEKPVHLLIILHLTGSVALHVWAIYVQSHDVFRVFPMEYSYFALVYFVFFAWRSWTFRLEGADTARAAA